MIARLSTRHCVRGDLRRGLVALARCRCVAGSARSPQAPAAHSRRPAPLLLAKQIVEIKGTSRSMFQPLVRGVIEKVKDQFLQTNFMWRRTSTRSRPTWRRSIAPRVNELVDASARIYASHFTERN